MLRVPAVIGAAAIDPLLDIVGEDFAELDLGGRGQRAYEAIFAAGGPRAGQLRRLQGHDDRALLRARRGGAQPELGCDWLPGPHLCASVGGGATEADLGTRDRCRGSSMLEADVCVVGSGAGGAVIAARLQQAGRSVVVLEQGAYTSEADLLQLELHDGARTYLNGGLFWSESGSVGILAGSTLGGGTFVNSLVCLQAAAADARGVGGVRPRGAGRAGVRPPYRHGVGAPRRQYRGDRPQRKQSADDDGARGEPVARGSSCLATPGRTIRATAATATPAASAARSSRRSSRTCRTPPTPAPASSSAAAPSGCSSRTEGQSVWRRS